MEAPFSVSPRGAFTVVAFHTTSLSNAADLERIRKGLSALVDKDHPAQLLLDLTPVKYLSSQAIGLLVNLHKTATVGGGKFVLCGLTPQLLQLLRVTRMDQVFTIVKDQKEATGT